MCLLKLRRLIIYVSNIDNYCPLTEQTRRICCSHWKLESLEERFLKNYNISFDNWYTCIVYTFPAMYTTQMGIYEEKYYSELLFRISIITSLTTLAINFKKLHFISHKVSLRGLCSLVAGLNIEAIETKAWMKSIFNYKHKI